MDRTEDRNAALLEAGLALASELSLDAVLQRIVELGVEITGATYGALGVLGPEGRITDFLTTGISEEERARIGDLPVGRGILGVLIRDARPLRLAEIASDRRSVGFPPNHPPMHSFLGAAVKARGRVFGNIYLTEKRGASEFTQEDEDAVTILASQAGVAIENARLHQEARQRERRLEAVREISSAILKGSGLEEVLSLVARRARELVGAELATISTPAGPGSLVIAAADGLHAQDLLGHRYPAEASIAGDVMAKGKPRVLVDAPAEEGAYQPILSLGEIGPAIFVPLGTEPAFGSLAVANRVGGATFEDDDVTLVETFAEQAAVALEYRRFQAELERLAVLEDRERIAKELHDGVIQSLFAVGMGLQGTATLSKDPDLEHRIESAVDELDRVVRDLRNYIFGLRPGILADRQLAQALQALAQDFEEKTGITTAVDIDEHVSAELSSRAGDIVQLAREALSNVGRHSGATTCRLSLHRRGAAATLEIDDDGHGFDPRAAPSSGQGLRNLRGRAESLGGELDIESADGEGTTVRVSVPL